MPPAKNKNTRDNLPLNAEQELKNEVDRLKEEMENLKIQMSTKVFNETINGLQIEIDKQNLQLTGLNIMRCTSNSTLALNHINYLQLYLSI